MTAEPNDTATDAQTAPKSAAEAAATPLRLFHAATSWRQIIRMSLVVLISWLVFLTMLTTFQRRLVFLGYRPGPKVVMPLPSEAAATGQLHAVDVPSAGANDVGLIRGWASLAVPNRSLESGLHEGRPLVIYFGGNASNRSRRMRSVQLFNRLMTDVLIVDYRGYADNEGSPSETAFVADARAVWEYATEVLGVSPGRIVICGESLGGAVAARLAADVCGEGTPPAGLILRATFASLVETAAYHYPFVPVRVFLIDRFRTDQIIGQVTCPILQFHGVKDQVVPYRHGRELFRNAPAESASGVPKRWVTLWNAGHNNILWVDGEVFERETRQFLTTVAPEGPRLTGEAESGLPGRGKLRNGEQPSDVGRAAVPAEE